MRTNVSHRDFIGFDRRTLTVSKTLEFRHGQKAWRTNPPNTQHGYHTIPLTSRACDILREAHALRKNGKKSDKFDTALPYLDRCVHVTDKTMSQAIEQFEKCSPEPTGGMTSKSCRRLFLFRGGL